MAATTVASSLFQLKGQESVWRWTVEKNQPQTGLTRVTCPGLSQSLKPETKVLSGLGTSSHVPPPQLRMGSADSLLFPATI